VLVDPDQTREDRADAWLADDAAESRLPDSGRLHDVLEGAELLDLDDVIEVDSGHGEVRATERGGREKVRERVSNEKDEGRRTKDASNEVDNQKTYMLFETETPALPSSTLQRLVMRGTHPPHPFPAFVHFLTSATDFASPDWMQAVTSRLRTFW
jgi:hypothetical protein